jgi:hypothetical protein
MNQAAFFRIVVYFIWATKENRISTDMVNRMVTQNIVFTL